MGNDAQMAREMIRAALATGAAVEVAADGLSMGDGLAQGVRLVVKSMAGACWGCGAVVVFERNGQWIAHRVVWRLPGGRRDGAACITKGDGVCGIDRPFVRQGELVGIVAGLLHEGQTRDMTCAVRRIQGVWTVLRGLMAMGVARVFRGRDRQHPGRA